MGSYLRGVVEMTKENEQKIRAEKDRQLKEKIAEERRLLEEKRRLDEAMAQQALADRGQQVMPEAEAEGSVGVKPGVNLTSSSPRSKEIIDAYTKQNGGKGPDESGVFVFPTLDDAINFYTEQARLGLCFFDTQVDANNQPVQPDFHVFSCGDGHLYKGTYAEIEKELTLAASNNPLTAKGLQVFKERTSTVTPPVSTANEFRQQLLAQQKKEEPAPEPSVVTPTAATKSS
jgi:hypothetical protein